jgi:hypothetical protein
MDIKGSEYDANGESAIFLWAEKRGEVAGG